MDRQTNGHHRDIIVERQTDKQTEAVGQADAGRKITGKSNRTQT